jgi:glycosyltransferase involved in cell wall biosynthesis
MKIVHVTQYFHPDKGYQENSLALEQIKLGHKVTIICSDDLTLWASDDNRKAAILNKEETFSLTTGIKILRLKTLVKLSGRIFVKGLKKKISEEDPDILILHGVFLPSTLLSLLSLDKGSGNVKVIIDDHMVNAGSFNSYSSVLYKIFRPGFHFLLRKSKTKVSKWVAVSAETKDFMINSYGITDKIDLIPLGYNEKTCFYDPVAAENWRLESDLPSTYKYVLYIGKCDEYKNPIDLFASFKKFQERHSDFALLIVGEVSESYRASIIQRAASLEISDKVFIKPPVKNLEINKVLSLARMVIWPHGSSMTMLEAMACNCPVIASEIEVNKERLSDGRGLMFKNLGNDLFTQMDTLEQKREDIILNAKKWVSQFTWESINRQFLKDLD